MSSANLIMTKFEYWILVLIFLNIFFSTAQNWGKRLIGQRLYFWPIKNCLISRGGNKLPYLRKYSNLEPIFNIQHSNFIITKSVHEMPRTWQNLWGIQALKKKSITTSNCRPFNLHLDFWKSRSWEIKVLFKP